MQQLETLNDLLFARINGGDGTPVWLVHAAIVLANDLIYLIPLLLLGSWLWGDHARRSLAAKACLVAVLGIAVNLAIGALWPHPRPFMVGMGHTWMPHAADASFPSDHMTVFAAIGLTLLLDGAAAWGLAILVTGLGVAWARVFLGVHFPLDMVGSVGVAALVYAAVTPLWRAFGAAVVALGERLYRRVLSLPIALGWIRA